MTSAQKTILLNIEQWVGTTLRGNYLTAGTDTHKIEEFIGTKVNESREKCRAAFDLITKGLTILKMDDDDQAKAFVETLRRKPTLSDPLKLVLNHLQMSEGCQSLGEAWEQFAQQDDNDTLDIISGEYDDDADVTKVLTDLFNEFVTIRVRLGDDKTLAWLLE